MHIALGWVIAHPMGQITSRLVRLGLSFGSKQSLFGWLGHLPVVACPLKKNGKKNFFNEKMKFRRVTRHFKGVPGSPNPVSNANFTSILGWE